MSTHRRDAQFWNRIAKGYAKRTIADMAGYERTLDRTAQYLKPENFALELGCGTGTTAIKLAPKIRKYIATDLSDAMVEIGKEKATLGSLGNVEFKAVPSDQLSQANASVDAVIAFNVLHLIADRAPVFREVHRILKPGGYFISKTPCVAEMNFLVRPMVGVMRLVGIAPTVAFFTGDALVKEVEAAGFNIIERSYFASKGRDRRPFLVAQKI